MPFTAKNCGRINSPATINTNVRKKDIRAEILPFENAVNIADAKIFIPLNKKPRLNIANPPIAML